MKAFTIILFFLIPSICIGGGDYVSVQIVDMDHSEGIHTIVLNYQDKNLFEANGCRSIKVIVDYGRVPWYSILPFFNSSHPKPLENSNAIDYLQVKFKENKVVNFGYMGDGLQHLKEKCTYKSKGLMLYDIGKEKAVVSFFNAV